MPSTVEVIAALTNTNSGNSKRHMPAIGRESSRSHALGRVDRGLRRRVDQSSVRPVEIDDTQGDCSSAPSYTQGGVRCPQGSARTCRKGVNTLKLGSSGPFWRSPLTTNVSNCSLWEGPDFDWRATFTFQAVDEARRPGQASIGAATKACATPARARDGSDAASIGAWPENGVFAAPPGPRRNGRPS